MAERDRAVLQHPRLVQIDECLDAEGGIVLPPGDTLISLIERNIEFLGDSVAFRYLDYAGPADPEISELTWSQLGIRLHAIGARLQQVTERGERVAILAPQGLEYVAGFYAAVKIGTIAVPLFAPELPGHAERLTTALADSAPDTVLTTSAALRTVEDFLLNVPSAQRPSVLVIDDIPDSAAEGFTPVPIDIEEVSHLQYTSGTTRPPVGVEVTHRAVGTNLLQMILAIDLLDPNTHGLSWLPLYHDMGLSMIGFPAVYGGHSTLMSPTAFIRRPQRWIRAISDQARYGRVVTAAPNFAYELTAQRGVPADGAGDGIDLGNVVMIIGSEPVHMAVIDEFTKVFSPYGLSRSAIKPSYGIAEATLFVSTIAPDAEPQAAYLDRDELAAGRVIRTRSGDPGAAAHVSCGHIARSLWAVIVDPATGLELPDGRVGEVWLHGDNVGRGYWNRLEETRAMFGATLVARLTEGSRAEGCPSEAFWLRTGDLGFYLDGELYIPGRVVDLLTVGQRTYYPQDIEATVTEASLVVRRGYAVAFSAPGDELPEPHTATDGGGRLVIVAERAMGTARIDPGSAIESIRRAVRERHGVAATDVRLLPAGAIPRTTSGKLGRQATRRQYLTDTLGRHR